jgi:hypothetical protein
LSKPFTTQSEPKPDAIRPAPVPTGTSATRRFVPGSIAPAEFSRSVPMALAEPDRPMVK